VRLCVGAAALLAGCQISVMGGEPITLIGRSDVGSGGTTLACGEPDDARRAREADGGCPDACAIDVAAGTTDCENVRLDEVRQGVATIDLHDVDGAIITLEICDPTGVAFQIADSRTADGDGGDAGTSSHDAHVLLDGTTLHVHASEGSGVEPSTVSGWIPMAGCSTRTLVMEDQLVYLVEADAGVCGTGLLRVDPPADAEGSPDALWYFAAGTIDGTQAGSGVRSARLCFW
jgi:hypothetical protein